MPLPLPVLAIVVGVLATIVLDLWSALLRHVFGLRTLDWALAGRWLGHAARGRFRHERIADAAAIGSERAIGWVFHYATGIAFAGVLLAWQGPAWAMAPTLPPCLMLGLATVVFPFFVMQPAMGAGIAASRAPQPLRARLQSLTTHLVFGIALYLAVLFVATAGAAA